MGTTIDVTLDHTADGTHLELEWSRLFAGQWTAPLPQTVSGRAGWASTGVGFAAGTSGSARYRLVGHDGARLGTVQFSWDAPFGGEHRVEAWSASISPGAYDAFADIRGDELASTRSVTFVVARVSAPTELHPAYPTAQSHDRHAPARAA